MTSSGRRALAGLCLAGTLAGCGGGGGNGSGLSVRTSTVPPVAITAAPAQPTGSGAALSQSYRQRCAASLARERPARARGAGTVTQLRMRSPDSSGTVRSAWVYRPGGVSDSARLPVLYVLHGYPGGPAGPWTKRGTARVLDAQFARGARPYLVVTLDGSGTKHPDTEWADSVDGADKVETFVLSVAIPAVEGAHRRDACHRAIAGFSMGGYGAMNLAQRHPDFFGQVAATAGYFRISDPDRVFGNDAAALRANSPDQQVGRSRGLRVFLLDAGQENLALVQGEAERFAHLLIAEKITVQLDFAPGTHNLDYAIAQQPAVATFLEAGWRPQTD
jgi:S-formylglutathione hydrolase FrmB